MRNWKGPRIRLPATSYEERCRERESGTLTASMLREEGIMNMLTKNRIIEQGDEYLAPTGEWKSVPKEDHGLQIMFTKYEKVRRPSEAPIGQPNPVVVEHNTVVPRTEPIRTEPKPIEQINEAIERKLPTVVSVKAHKSPFIELSENLVERAKLMADRAEEKRDAELKRAGVALSDNFSKTWPPVVTFPPVWTGRNGTFQTLGLNMTELSGKIMLQPIGKRGNGNCVIEFPVSIIPDIVDWLLRHQR